MKTRSNLFALAVGLAIFASFALVDGEAQAFQVYSADQLENGIGVRGGVGFKDNYAEETQGLQMHFHTSNGSVNRGNAANMFGGYYEGNNWYGRQDSGGRSFGDRRDTSWQNCSNVDSQVGMLNAFGSGHGGSYPCQRFR